LDRDVDLLFGREIDRARITRVDVAEDANSWITGKDAFQSPLRIFCAVSDDDHSGVLRVTDPDTATVVN
jgi:hypothetical protein